MKIALDRIPNIGRALGYHVLNHTDNGLRVVIPCEHEVAAVRLTVQIDGEKHVHYLTRDEASELGQAFAEVLCDA